MDNRWFLISNITSHVTSSGSYEWPQNIHPNRSSLPLLWIIIIFQSITGIMLCMRPADRRRRYIVASSLIGWAHTQNDTCNRCEPIKMRNQETKSREQHTWRTAQMQPYFCWVRSNWFHHNKASNFFIMSVEMRKYDPFRQCHTWNILDHSILKRLLSIIIFTILSIVNHNISFAFYVFSSVFLLTDQW